MTFLFQQMKQGNSVRKGNAFQQMVLEEYVCCGWKKSKILTFIKLTHIC
jgi:hypothetical protein